MAGSLLLSLSKNPMVLSWHFAFHWASRSGFRFSSDSVSKVFAIFFCVVSFLAIFLFSPRTKRSNDVGEGKKSKVIPGMLGMLGIHPRAARAQNST